MNPTMAELVVIHQHLDRAFASDFRVSDFDHDHHVIWKMNDGSFVLEIGTMDIDCTARQVVFEYKYFKASESDWNDAAPEEWDAEYEELDSYYLDEEYYA